MRIKSLKDWSAVVSKSAEGAASSVAAESCSRFSSRTSDLLAAMAESSTTPLPSSRFFCHQCDQNITPLPVSPAVQCLRSLTGFRLEGVHMSPLYVWFRGRTGSTGS